MAAIEVSVMMEVTVKLEAENATEAELLALVERDPSSVRGAVERRMERCGRYEAEAGWLDEDRSAFVTDVTGAEAAVTEYARGQHNDALTIVR